MGAWADTTIDAAAVASLDDEVLDWRHKGLPPLRDGVRLGDLGAAGWHALDGDLPMPAMLLHRGRLERNVAEMAAFCREHGVLLAPHAKTSMAPQVIARQVAAGCWALTAATPAQLRVHRHFGVQRILYANQLLEPVVLEWLAAELAADPGFELLCLVDSVAGVQRMDGVLRATALPRPLRVLLEVGHAGGRAGCRSVEDALAVGAAVRDATHLELAGVETFEGLIRQPSLDATLAAIDALLATCDAVLAALRDAGLLGAPALLTAGGSAWFDRVLAAVRGRDDVVAVLRSGCYVTQDGGFYDEMSPLAGRADGPRRLENALEAWGLVQSRPEPGLAIASFGKRDVPMDLALPRAVKRHRAGRGVTALPEPAEVVALSDQHAHVRVPPGLDLRVGDLLGAVISHPCTAFDKWRLLPEVDDDYRVLGGVLTFF